jgi:hypothetical protein
MHSDPAAEEPGHTAGQALARTVIAAVVACVALLPAGVSAADAPQTPTPTTTQPTPYLVYRFSTVYAGSGPHVSAATVSHGRLTVSLTFHKTATFVAIIIKSPPANPFRATASRTGREVSLGKHSAGTGMVSFRLQLGNGRYGVIITPVARMTTSVKSKEASWIYLTSASGKIVRIRLVQP